MKKLLAAVLAVALVAVVGVAATTRPAPVAAPEDDVVVPVADVAEPAPVDEAPAEDVKTAVLGASTDDEDDTTDEDDTVADEPVVLSDDPTTVEGDNGSETEGETGNPEGSTNTEDTEDTEETEPVLDEDFRWHHTTTPNDGASIDANGNMKGFSWGIVENTGGDIQFIF